VGPGADGIRAGPAYHRAMDAVLAEISPALAAKVWHYWIALPLVGGGLLAVVATIVGYLKKVQSLKYPPQERLRPPA